MKDYSAIVVWLDYFNKTLPRSSGRRLKKDACVYDPSIKDLAAAAEAAGYKVSESRDDVRYPRRPYVRSGYVAVQKSGPKAAALARIGARLADGKKRQP